MSFFLIAPFPDHCLLVPFYEKFNFAFIFSAFNSVVLLKGLSNKLQPPFTSYEWQMMSFQSDQSYHYHILSNWCMVRLTFQNH